MIFYIGIIGMEYFGRLVTLREAVGARLFLSLKNTFRTKRGLYDALRHTPYILCINAEVFRRIKIKERFAGDLDAVEFEYADSDQFSDDGEISGYFSYQYTYSDVALIEKANKEKLVKEQLRQIEKHLRQHIGLE